VQVARIRDMDIKQDRNKVAREVIRELGDSWAIITYGVTQEDAVFISNFLEATSSLKACIHFTISCESPADFIPRSSAGHVLP
jgi:hypothetical protein